MSVASAGRAPVLLAHARDLFPGGVSSPVRAYRAVGGEPPILVRGAGPRVWDVDGREYLDLVGAFGPLILGHAHPAVLAALHERVDLGGPFGATGPLDCPNNTIMPRGRSSFSPLSNVVLPTES